MIDRPSPSTVQTSRVHAIRDYFTAEELLRRIDGDGEMVHQLKELVALTEDQALVTTSMW